MKLFNENEIDWSAFQDGQAAYYHSNNNVKKQNPFTVDTDQWYSWNRGWNTVEEGIKEQVFELLK